MDTDAARRPAIRVLHCPAAVGGNPGHLAVAERELGLESWAVSLEPVHEGYEIDEVLWRPGTSRLSRELRRWWLLRRALDFDVVHFNFGSSILPKSFPKGSGGQEHRLGGIFRRYASLVELRDVAWLKRAGKAVFVTFQGDDARQMDRFRALAEPVVANEIPLPPASDALDARRRRWIATFDRYADGLYALNPDLLHVLPRRAEFLPYAHLDLREWRAPQRVGRGDVPRLVHAPTDRARKGTRFIVDAVERLRAEGLAIEFDLVEWPTSRREARERYERADVAVDQLLAGWYGGFSVELMALGKPVICHLRERDLEFVPEAMRRELPVLRADPNSIYEVLREWLTTRREELPALGEQSRVYVERWHDPMTIAGRVVADYERALARRRTGNAD